MARILIVDDEEAIREMFRDVLETAGHQVLEAEDGKKGIAVQQTLGVDLVITDMIMPVQDGLETIRILRRDYPELPILAISGGGRTNDLSLLRKAVAEGAAATLVKPFAVGKLMDTINLCFSAGSTPKA